MVKGSEVHRSQVNHSRWAPKRPVWSKKKFWKREYRISN